MNDINLGRGLKLRDLKKQMMSILASFGIEGQETSAESELIIEHVSKMNRSQQLVCSDIPLADKQVEQIEQFLNRRKSRMPIQYCLEAAYFAGSKFKVRKGVFIPRDDTETLVIHSLALIQNHKYKKPVRVLEIGVGSGAISVSVLLKNSDTEVTATDISEAALDLALENGKEHKVLDRFSLVQEGLWWTLDKKFDHIICNPPYIPESQKKTLEPEVIDYEPHEALFGKDEDGLRFYRKLSTTAMKLFDLTGGSIAVEVGDGQAGDVAEIFRKEGWSSLQVEKDINGISRVVSGFWKN